MGKRYLLVIVDSYCGWAEAYPTLKEDVLAVEKALFNHYITNMASPKRIRSDKDYKNKILNHIVPSLLLQVSPVTEDKPALIQGRLPGSEGT